MGTARPGAKMTFRSVGRSGAGPRGFVVSSATSPPAARRCRASLQSVRLTPSGTKSDGVTITTRSSAAVFGYVFGGAGTGGTGPHSSSAPQLGASSSSSCSSRLLKSWTSMKLLMRPSMSATVGWSGAKRHSSSTTNLYACLPRRRSWMYVKSLPLRCIGICRSQLLNVPVMYTWRPPCSHRKTVGTVSVSPSSSFPSRSMPSPAPMPRSPAAPAADAGTGGIIGALPCGPRPCGGIMPPGMGAMGAPMCCASRSPSRSAK
mmetsp:Transcript_10539/g.31746  ORF Transcript_10539/g.31746 Transcript_10539/m.31746 type:complete len:261 (-) Transcript_10539:189-971(-)